MSCLACCIPPNPKYASHHHAIPLLAACAEFASALRAHRPPCETIQATQSEWANAVVGSRSLRSLLHIRRLLPAGLSTPYIHLKKTPAQGGRRGVRPTPSRSRLSASPDWKGRCHRTGPCSMRISGLVLVLALPQLGISRQAPCGNVGSREPPTQTNTVTSSRIQSLLLPAAPFHTQWRYCVATAYASQSRLADKPLARQQRRRRK